MVEKSAIEIKKKKLKEELSKEHPNKRVVQRLEESIKRHKSIGKWKKQKRIKNKRRHGRL